MFLFSRTQIERGPHGEEKREPSDAPLTLWGGTAVVAVLLSSLTNICRFLLANGLPGSAILDAVVFRKVREATGGRMRLCMNGAAPIAKDTQEFLSLAIAPLINGYGSTETTAYALYITTPPPSPSSLT